MYMGFISYGVSELPFTFVICLEVNSTAQHTHLCTHMLFPVVFGFGFLLEREMTSKSYVLILPALVIRLHWHLPISCLHKFHRSFIEDFSKLGIGNNILRIVMILSLRSLGRGGCSAFWLFFFFIEGKLVQYLWFLLWFQKLLKGKTG